MQSHESRQVASWLIFDVRRMISWRTLKQTSEAGVSWIESRFLEDGLRCSRVGRSYYCISRGSDWRTEVRGKTAKIEFVRGPIVDVKIRSRSASDIRRIMKFAFRCLCDPQPLPPLDTPILDFYPKRIKHLICCVRYYESTHPKYGSRFSGSKPPVSIEDLIDMVVDAHDQKFIRVPASAFRFDQRD